MTFRDRARQRGVTTEKARDPDRDPPGNRLSLRLRAVASLVPSGSRVGDIGTDHGALPRWLLETGRAVHCVATERYPSRLAAASRDFPVPRNLELRSGDGLAPLRAEDRLDVVTINGIGARAISRILSSPLRTSLGVGRFVLQPQSQWAELRRRLAELDLAIVDERLIEDRGRFYLVLTAVPDEAAETAVRTDAERRLLDEAGPCLIRSRDPSVRRYWERRLKLAENVARRIRSEADRATALREIDLARCILAILGRET